ncbi:MAG: penicillin-binding protein 1B [Marinobacter sp.]|nr:penicillin-binding protein 1B [Marinobacter sp.]
MTKPRKKTQSRTRKDRRRSLWARLWRLTWQLALLALAILAGWLVYLDAIVTSRFEGKRWEVPSRVYARPLELYDGASLTRAGLQQELALMGYRSGDGARPGTYRQAGSRVLIGARGFQFPDGLEPPRQLQFDLVNGRAANLRVLRGEDSPIVRLEPAQIGGIYPGHREDRVLIQVDDMPAHFEAALLAIEDRDFYQHWGVSPAAIARASLVNLRAGRVVQGGSTLTQQLVKNFFLTRDQTLLRKVNEAFMSVLLEWRYDKPEILEAYLNEVYLGQAGSRAIHGFGLASQFYFGDRFADLELHQAALLVAIVRGPSFYDPRRHPERALQRRNLVLATLAEQGAISESQAREARAKPLGVVARPNYSENRYPAFIDLVRRHLARDYRTEDLQSEGLRIFTTLDPALQAHAERSVSQTLAQLDGPGGEQALEAAMLVTARDSGEVVALVGGRDPQFAGFNRAVDARRPIGSLIKPFVYLAALQQPADYTLITPLNDRPFSLVFDDGRRWEPKNYDGRVHGDVALHEALAKSYNLAAVRLGLDVGVDRVIELLQKLGVEHPVSRYPSMLLGATAMTPVTVASLYQGIASSGFNTPLRTIRSVTDASGQALSRYPLAVAQVADPAAVHLVQYGLQEVMQEGTGRSAYRWLSRDLMVAGKTGTTDDGRDSWFAGFSGDWLAVTWVGRDDNGPTRFSGATGALPVWASFMAEVPQHGFTPIIPDGIGYHWVQSEQQALTNEHCPGARLMPFIVGSEPVAQHSCPGETGRRLRHWFEGLFR